MGPGGRRLAEGTYCFVVTWQSYKPILMIGCKAQFLKSECVYFSVDLHFVTFTESVQNLGLLYNKNIHGKMCRIGPLQHDYNKKLQR